MTRYAVKFLYLGFLLFPTILWSLNLTFESKPVVSIQFKGQENIPESELKKLISFKTGGFLQKPSLFNQRVLDWDRNEIQRYFISEGYLHCHVTDSLSLNENNEVNIFIFIDEGPRFYVNSVTLEGNTLISDEKIQSLLSAEPGKPFRPFDYQRGLQSMRDEYAKIGYPFITIDERIQESSNHIDITLILDEDGLYTVDNIDIKGNNTVLEKTIRKELVVKPGDVYNLKNIQKSRLHIFELGTFNSVNIVPVAPKPDSLTVGLQVQVLESKPRRWDANIGIKQGRIADLNQTYLFTEVEWLHKNLFHRAHRLQAKGNFGIVWDQETFFKKSSPSYGMDVSYTRPRIFSLRLPTTFKVYYNKNVYS
ncbi:MAG: POTRA domain-containing protein, partial [Candidatus Marinimicrobia bacterium]|nr:POTRA domain-containing protein [Candidatus Neomarinimicrobiota bacterium]